MESKAFVDTSLLIGLSVTESGQPAESGGSGGTNRRSSFNADSLLLAMTVASDAANQLKPMPNGHTSEMLKKVYTTRY